MLEEDSSKMDICTRWYNAYKMLPAIRVLAAISLGLLNYFFEVLLVKLTKFGRFNNTTSEKLSIMTYHFFAVLFNTGVTVIIANITL